MVQFPGETVEYRAARDVLLQREISLRRELEAVAAARRALPPGGEVPEDYLFEEIDEHGRVRNIALSELFAPGTDALAIYNYMFPRHCADERPGPSNGATAILPLAEGPCPSCTALIDQLDGAVPHIAAHANLVVVARAPIERVAGFARERGWRHIRVVSSHGNSFAVDYGGEVDGQQMPDPQRVPSGGPDDPPLLGVRAAVRTNRSRTRPTPRRDLGDSVEHVRPHARRPRCRLGRTPQLRLLPVSLPGRRQHLVAAHPFSPVGHRPRRRSPWLSAASTAMRTVPKSREPGVGAWR